MRRVLAGWVFLVAGTVACDDETLRRVLPSDAGVRADASAGRVDARADDAATAADDAAPGPLDAVPADDAAPGPLDAVPADDAAPGPLDAVAADDAAAGPEDAVDAEDAAPGPLDAAAAEDAAPGPLDAGARPCVALQFDGLLNHVLIPDSPSLNPSGPLTVEAWVRTESGVVNPPWYPNLVSKRATNTIYPSWGLGIWNTLQPYSVGNGAWVVGSTQVPFGRWTHVAAVFDQTQIRFFVDGAPAGSSPAAAMGPANQEPVILGTLTNDTQNYRGDMAGLRVSSTARYSGAFVPAASWASDADTMLLLAMDEGTGATAGDTSGNGNHGAINGATWVAGCPP